MEQLPPGAYADPVVVRSPPEAQHAGAWQATVSFRKLDGEDVQYELRTVGETEEAARRNAVAAVDQERGTHVQTMGFDTAAVRRYIAAASHMHDLRRATSALEAADSTDDTSAQEHLRVQAVSIYGRTWGSNARGDLAEYIELSAADADLTETVRILRNRFAVHSENSMTTTVPLFDLHRQADDQVVLSAVRSVTFEHSLPHDFVEKMRAMLARLAEQLTEALETLKRPIIGEATPEMLAALFQRPELIQMRAVAADDWSPDDRRPPFPASRFRDVHMVPGNEGSTSATLTR